MNRHAVYALIAITTLSLSYLLMRERAGAEEVTQSSVQIVPSPNPRPLSGRHLPGRWVLVSGPSGYRPATVVRFNTQSACTTAGQAFDSRAMCVED